MLPFLMFSMRETMQDSLGFSPAELFFGHVIHGHLKLMNEQLLASESSSIPVTEYMGHYVNICHARDLAKIYLMNS